jgi:secreted Zn-dependent insulinase-like peptidase
MLECIGERFWELHEGERSEKIYELALNDLIEEYQNFYCEDADRIANETLSLILNEGDPSIEQIKERLEQLEYEDIQNRVSKFWERGKAVWTIVGNF